MCFEKLLRMFGGFGGFVFMIGFFCWLIGLFCWLVSVVGWIFGLISLEMVYFFQIVELFGFFLWEIGEKIYTGR